MTDIEKKGKCSDLDCGYGYKHKKNSSYIECNDEKCSPTIDKEKCCDKEDVTLKTISTIITVFSVLTLIIIFGLALYKISKKDDKVSIYTRFFILNLLIKLLTSIFYLIPLDGIFVTIINKLFNKNWTSLIETANLDKWGMFQTWASRSVIITTTLFGFAVLGFHWSLTSEMEWMKYIIITVMIILLAAILGLLGKDTFSKYGNVFPSDGDQSDKRSWLFKETGRYLKYIIGSGIALAVLSIVIYLFSNNILFTVGGTQIIMAFMSIILMGVIYYLIQSNKKAQKTIKKNKTIGKLFYLFFLIPCFFHDLVKYIYIEFRHTPNVIYTVFFIEILLISMYLILPMIKKKLYTSVSVADDKDNLININIRNLENEIYILKKQKSKIQKELSMAGIKKSDFEKITKDGLDNDEDELKLFLLNLDFKADEIIDEKKSKSSNRLDNAIKLVQEKTSKVRGIENEIENKNAELNRIKELKKNQTSDKARVLLRKPICLKKETRLYEVSRELTDKYTQYNYNYAISGWFFLRANRGFKNEYKQILNYNNRPKILYNSYTNKLKVIMASGEFDEREFIYDDLPLQKWFNIVINYDSGVLDIFIDSKFVSSMNNVVPKDMRPGELIVGGGNVGGGVCNVMMFPNSISKERIDLNYKLLKNKNPPIV